jgi:hypothetical protein
VPPEAEQNGATGRIGQRGERSIEGLILNHMVQLLSIAPGLVKP